MQITVKLFKHANSRFYRTLFRLAGFRYHHANLQIGTEDYHLHVRGLICCGAERGDREVAFEVSEAKYNWWRSLYSNERKRFHVIRYLLSPWRPYPNCISFASSLVTDRIFYHPNDFTEYLENVHS